MLLSAPPFFGGGVQQPFLRTPTDGIPHLIGNPGPLVNWWPLHPTSRCPTSTGAVHKSVTCSCVFMLVQLKKCVVVCGSDLQRGHSGNGCLTSAILFKYERSRGHFCSELGPGTMGCLGECCFGVMYCEWYGVCDCVVLSILETCADYGGVNVFHVCLKFDVVYGVGVCVNVCDVVCVVC